MGIETYAVMNDMHIPYHHKSYDLALIVAKHDPNLKAIIINGDFGEFESVGSHRKRKDSIPFLEQELFYINKELDVLQNNFHGVKIFYLEGNHEDRVDRYIRDNCAALNGLINLEHALKIDKRPGFYLIPYNARQLFRIGNSHVYAKHLPLSAGQTHAKITADNSSVDIIYAHTHGYQSYMRKRLGPDSPKVIATSNLCLCDFENKDIFDYRGDRDNWGHGFSMIQYNPDLKVHNLNTIHINNLRCIYNGTSYAL